MLTNFIAMDKFHQTIRRNKQDKLQNKTEGQAEKLIEKRFHQLM
jgi:hypothetical protein